MDRLHELSNKKGGLIGSSTGFTDLDKKLIRDTRWRFNSSCWKT